MTSKTNRTVSATAAMVSVQRAPRRDGLPVARGDADRRRFHDWRSGRELAIGRFLRRLADRQILFPGFLIARVAISGLEA
jgi:hypothetical protein